MASAKQGVQMQEGVPVLVGKNWDGGPVGSEEGAQVCWRRVAGVLEVDFDAPFHGDPCPAQPPGELDGLWNYEVVELFLLGKAGHYVEIELGPHGHYLVLLLTGVRQVHSRLQPSHFQARIAGRRWQASLRLELAQLPLPFTHANAYAIHGQGVNRRYLAACPVPGEQADFHQPRFFAAIT